MSEYTYVEAFRMAREIVPLTNDQAHHLCQVFALASRLSLAFSTGEFLLSVDDATRLFEQGGQISPVGAADGRSKAGVGMHGLLIGNRQVGGDRPNQTFAGGGDNEAHSNSSFSFADGESAGELPTPSCTKIVIPEGRLEDVTYDGAGNFVVTLKNGGW